jgi:hypothetical protein
MKIKILVPALLICFTGLSAETLNLKITNPNKSQVKDAPFC